MLKIGNITINSGCVLAPLAGISDQPFRMINRRTGCEFAFTEMISSHALIYQNKKTLGMLETRPEDRPLGVQLLGNDPEIIKKALDLINNYEFDLIDFNAACPVSKVAGKGKGAGLLKEPRKLHDLLKIIVDNSKAPVTVKIRTGWDENSVNAKEVALCAQDAGIDGLFIHGRTRTQKYSGVVDYAAIREVKNALQIPVIASGNAFSPILIKKIFDDTGCDGVVIARGALGNPWIFRETAEFLKNNVIPPRPNLTELTTIMTSHLGSCCAFHGEKSGVMIFRKFFGWYTKGIPDVNPLKKEAFQAKTRGQMADLIHEVLSVSP